jgi:tRNA-specific 2-thiouridylase
MSNNRMQKQKVFVGMSGGVDSSVTAALLKEKGYEVIGFMFTNWHDTAYKNLNTTREKKRCCSLESFVDARNVADALGIPLHLINIQDAFKEHIVDHYLSMYRNAQTPNPCARCNKYIKFGAMLDYMKQYECDLIATGHYCRNVVHDGLHEIHAAKDTKKDQTYFMYHLTQEKLTKILWPIGEMKKQETYALAEKLKLPLKPKRESQDICFVPDNKPEEFLKRNLNPGDLTPGPIRTTAGEILKTQHKGLALYTIGQRRGIDIGGLSEPMYVVELDNKNNTLVIGPDSDTYARELIAEDLSFVSGNKPTKSLEVQAKVRYRMTLVQATVTVSGDTAHVMFEEKIRGVTPGQVVAWYNGDILLGGGIIRKKC